MKLLSKLLQYLLPGGLEKEFVIICLKHLLRLEIVNAGHSKMCRSFY